MPKRLNVELENLKHEPALCTRLYRILQGMTVPKMPLNINSIITLVEEVRKTTKSKVILSPRESLPLRANLTEYGKDRRIRVEYSPSKCDTGDLAYELLRGMFITLGEKNESLLKASPKASKDDNLAISLINALLSVRWVMNELKHRGLKAEGILKEYLENSLIYLDVDGEAYAHIADPNYRRIYSAVNFAIYLLTKGEVDYGEAGFKFEELYKVADPEVLRIGSKAIAIIDANPLSWDGIRATANQLAELFKLKRDKIEDFK